MTEQDKNEIGYLRRRRFLQAAAGGTMFAACPPLRLAFADGPGGQVSFDDLSVLRPGEGKILLEVARTLFPHDFLDDTVYAAAVRQMDSLSSNDEPQADQIRTGLDQLPKNFVDLDQRGREGALGDLTGTPFFKLARRTTINAVYRDPEIWGYFGYPGPSLEFGGWINRELVDIDWLPEVDA